MEARIRALTPFWSWIPAFRAVAETEHLPSAARLIGVGPSALSRSISLLEGHLGRALFDRSGRSIALNEDGRQFLDAIRDAMRRVDDGLTDLQGGGLRGPLRVSSAGAATTVLVGPALLRLRALHPALHPHVVTRAPGDVGAELAAGRLDVAVQEHAATGQGLQIEAIGELSRGVYCGPEHALHGVDEIGAEALADAAFVAPPSDAAGQPFDGWPPDRPRRVAVTVDQLRVGLDLCQRTDLLAVLPDALAQGAGLHRLPVDVVAPTRVYAVRRRRLGVRPSAAEAFVDLLRGGVESDGFMTSEP